MWRDQVQAQVLRTAVISVSTLGDGGNKAIAPAPCLGRGRPLGEKSTSRAQSTSCYIYSRLAAEAGLVHKSMMTGGAHGRGIKCASSSCTWAVPKTRLADGWHRDPDLRPGQTALDGKLCAVCKRGGEGVRGRWVTRSRRIARTSVVGVWVGPTWGRVFPGRGVGC